MIWMLLAGCGSEPETYGDFTSRPDVDTPVLEPGTEDTGEIIDTAEDTGIEEINDKINFRTLNIPCSAVSKRVMTFTRFAPGGLNPDGEPLSTFFEEKERFALSNSSIVKTPVLNSSQTTGETPQDCLFSIGLETPPESDLQEVLLNDEGEVQEIGVQWAFYYPATYIRETPTCELLTLNASNTEKVSCSSIIDVGLSPTPVASMQDPPLIDGDIYEWGSDVVAVYVQGNIQGGFSDLGFEQGWNLAQLDEGELTVVESLSDLDVLSNIMIDNTDFLPRYHVNGKGSTSAEASFGTYSIGLVPVHWLNGVTSVSVGNSMYVQDNVISWSFELWGKPNSSQFFGLNFPISSPLYEQWSSVVDVAPFVPMVFHGNPTVYVDGDADMGDNIAATDDRLGSVCKDSSTLAFLYFAAAKKPSQALWYRQTGRSPGWYAYYGNHGDASSWRLVLENTDAANPYNYISLNIGPSCGVDADWQ